MKKYYKYCSIYHHTVSREQCINRREQERLAKFYPKCAKCKYSIKRTPMKAAKDD